MTFILKLYRFLFARPAFEGFNLLLNRLSLSGLGILNYENSHISGETFFLKGYLSDFSTGVVLDVGANVGRYSCEVLGINPRLQVFAFEPHPHSYLQLAANIAHPNFYAINAAVGNQTGSLTLYDYECDDGSSHASLHRQVIEEIHQKKSISHQVKVIRLDSYLKEQGIDDIKLIKIDIEGNELAVLQGLSSYLLSGKIQAIQFEFNEMNIISRVFFKDFWDLMPNFDFYRLLPTSMIPISKYAPLKCEIFAYQNIVAICKTSIPETR